MMAPKSGRRTIARYISAFHQIDVLDRDRAAVAEIDDEDGETDRGFRCRDREYEQREHLADDVAKVGRERDEIDIHGEQNELDRHQDDDDVLPIEEDAENPECEQDRSDGQIMAKVDGHGPLPVPPWFETRRCAALLTMRSES